MLSGGGEPVSGLHFGRASALLRGISQKYCASEQKSEVTRRLVCSAARVLETATPSRQESVTRNFIIGTPLTNSAATPGQWRPARRKTDSRRWLTRLVGRS